MNFTNLSIKLVEDNGFYDVLIRLDDAFANEFGEEFVGGKFRAESDNFQNLQMHIRSSFPDKKLRNARLVFHGLALATLPLTTRDEELAQNSRFLGLVSSYQPSTKPSDSTIPMQDYTVKFGDTLWIIAAKFNTTTAALSKMNKLQSAILETGQKISIPLNTAFADLY